MRCLGGILLLASVGLAGAGEPIVACPAEEAPHLDGKLDDAAWRRGAATPITNPEHVHPNYREAWRGVDDLSGTVRALTAGGVLYLGIEVRDDVLLHESGRAWWSGDSIELFLDTDLVSDEPKDKYSNDDLQLFLMPFHEGLRWGVVARGPDVAYPDGGLRSIRLASQRTPTGYTVEVSIPLFNLDPLRPDANGRIGFDLALNDVDDPAAVQAESYMTLSGRFDLYAFPDRFARLAIGPRADAAPPTAAEGVPLIDWTGLLLGLAAVVLLAVAARRAARGIARHTRVRAVTLSVLLVVAAAGVALLPSVVRTLDESRVRSRWQPMLQEAQAAATACLDLDTGDREARSDRLLALYRDGQVHIRPHYEFDFVPLSPEARAGPESTRAPATQHYGIRLEPGETRRFPLAGRAAPARLRLDLLVPDPRVRRADDRPAAEVSLEFSEGARLTAAPTLESATDLLLDTEQRKGAAMRALVVSNRLPSGVLVVDGLYAEEAGRWTAAPLAVRTPAGVPIDVWHARPQTHLKRVPSGGVESIPLTGSGHRLWLALGADGAFPNTPFDATVATIRVYYADGGTAPELTLRNGRDLESRLLAYARAAAQPESIALQWEDSVRQPVLYTLHSIALDPARRLERVEVTDNDVLTSLTVAAATIGRRALEAPARDSGLKLSGDRLFVREETRQAWSDLGFVVRSPAGATGRAGLRDGVEERFELAFESPGDGSLEVRMPRGSLAIGFRENASLVFGIAALLLAFAAVVAGAKGLQRARRLRVKMLIALAAATVVPLLFLVVSLTRILSERAEEELEVSTHADLRQMEERIAGRKARARELAAGARDVLELVPAGSAETLRRQAAHGRAEIEAQGGFLRLPEIDPAGPSPLGNVSAVDAVTRSGLYYSPWDGLMALGVARTARNRRCLVGLPAPGLLGGLPDGDVLAALFSPEGEPLATTGVAPAELASPAAQAGHRGHLREARRTGRPVYDATTRFGGETVAAAYTPLTDRGRVVGVLGVYRSRAATDAAKAEIVRTLLLSTLAALLLVVIAGGALVDVVTQRLQRVTRAARSIAEGDLASRAPVEADDEVGRLAASFNTMADSLDERVRQLTQLHRGLQELTAALDRTEVARAAAALLKRATGAGNIQVAALEPASDRLEPLHREGEGAPLGHRLPESGPARDAVELRRTIAREGAVFLPLVAGGRVVGLAVCSPAASADTAFLDVASRQIGIALENARLYHAAVTHEVSGLYTQSFFVRRLKEEVDRAAATGRPLSLLRLVIDDYRALAHRRGAAAATKLLVETAGVVETVLPRRNMLARGKAGELLALLVESDANAARSHTDRIGAALRRHTFASLGGDPAPTFTHRSVTYPRDGAGADILIDSLFEATERWAETAAETGPVLNVPPGLDMVEGRSVPMRNTLEVIARVAPTNATVLLGGETGAGKEVLADLLQANSGRHDQPYVKVNCAAIPETLLESELFGHEKGAFTGADRRHVGRFEAAHRGTLFLDEIGEVPRSMQVKLLRVLQERNITRVGGSRTIDVDVRIVAASNRDLAEAVRNGEFREDLYHRLHVIEIRVPSLRERREDIAGLIEQFRREFNRRHKLRIESFAPDALDELYRYDWPGNVRELRNVVERSMLMAPTATIDTVSLALPAQPDQVRETELRIDGLTPRQERILALARDTGGITNGDIVKSETISARTALREVQRLVERGLLIRVGRRRGAVYRPNS